MFTENSTLWGITKSLAARFQITLSDYNSLLEKVNLFINDYISKEEFEKYFFEKNGQFIDELKKSQVICDSLNNRLKIEEALLDKEV